jgi:hypothetical protein
MAWCMTSDSPRCLPGASTLSIARPGAAWVKSTPALANLVIFQTAQVIADVVRQLQADGRPVDV